MIVAMNLEDADAHIFRGPAHVHALLFVHLQQLAPLQRHRRVVQVALAVVSREEGGRTVPLERWKNFF